MILVIADDFTGAAELAGIALDYGLKTEVQTEIDANPNLDVLILDTNTRSKTSSQAEEVIDKLGKLIKDYDFNLIYKKTDSVLRGHIFTELKKLQEYYPDKSILLVPANPSQGRIIKDGRYLINEKLLHKTHFGNDPESPTITSDVMKLMKIDKQSDISLISNFEKVSFGLGKIYLAEAKNSDEINFWAELSTDDIIPAGGANFFEALLASKKLQKRTNKIETLNKNDFDRKRLFICGSSLSSVKNIKNILLGKKPKIIEISKDLLFRDNIKDFLQLVIESFKTTNSVIITMNISGNLSRLNTFKIPKLFADIAYGVFEEIDLDEILVEGGTTSSEVIRKIGWKRLKPIKQVGEGVIRLKVVDSKSNYLTVKPGSYEWPKDI